MKIAIQLCMKKLKSRSKQASFHQNSGINKLEESFNSGKDSVILNMKKTMHREKKNNQVKSCSELEILEINKQIFLSLNPINFNILVVGESGSGKTSFIKTFLKKVEKMSNKGKNYNDGFSSLDNNSSFNVFSEKNDPINEEDIKEGIFTSEFESYIVNNLSSSHNYNFKIIDSPGYGSNCSQTEWLNKILEYLHIKVFTVCLLKNFEYYKFKTQSKKENNHDTRIHLILYFMTGPSPKLNDYQIMKQLQNWGNIIPIIGRADGSEYDKVINVKSEIISSLKNYEIDIFDINSALNVTIIFMIEIDKGSVYN